MFDLHESNTLIKRQIETIVDTFSKCFERMKTNQAVESSLFFIFQLRFTYIYIYKQ